MGSFALLGPRAPPANGGQPPFLRFAAALPGALGAWPRALPCSLPPIAASGVDFRLGGDKAYYMPSLDVVQVPPQPAFFEQINFYRTCLHELTHYAERRIIPYGVTEWRISAGQPCGGSA